MDQDLRQAVVEKYGSLYFLGKAMIALGCIRNHKDRRVALLRLVAMHNVYSDVRHGIQVG